jgi:hypothetical protein
MKGASRLHTVQTLSTKLWSPVLPSVAPHLLHFLGDLQVALLQLWLQVVAAGVVAAGVVAAGVVAAGVVAPVVGLVVGSVAPSEADVGSVAALVALAEPVASVLSVAVVRSVGSVAAASFLPQAHKDMSITRTSRTDRSFFITFHFLSVLFSVCQFSKPLKLSYHNLVEFASYHQPFFFKGRRSGGIRSPVSILCRICPAQ